MASDRHGRRLAPAIECESCACRSVDACSCSLGCCERSHFETPIVEQIRAQLVSMSGEPSHVEVCSTTASELLALDVIKIDGYQVLINSALAIPWRVETYEPEPINPRQDSKATWKRASTMIAGRSLRAER